MSLDNEMDFCAMIAPVSMFSLMKNVLTPVSTSPFMIAQLIGAAPRYFGRRLACRFIVPNAGIFHTTSGNMRKATTTNKSAFKEVKSVKKDSSRNLSGCKMVSPCERAYCLTALC